jgi:hypothetical protein
MAEKKVIKYVGGPIRYEPHPEEKEKQAFYLVPAKPGEEDTEDDATKFWSGVAKQDLAQARLDEVMSKMKIRKLQTQKELQDIEAALRGAGEKDTKEGKDPNKKYDVNPETGVIDIVEEGEGEYTYKEALLRSSSIKGTRGEYEGAIAVLKAARDLGEVSEGKKDETAPKKEWYVADDGEINHDPENGELTLSEARAVSASKQRVLRGSGDTMTPEKIELRMRDLKDEWNKTLTEMEGRLRQRLTPTDQENPFILDDKGEITLNKNAKVSMTEYLLYQLINERKAPVLDAQGNLLKVPDTGTYLEVQRFEREERRKDKRNDEVISFIQDGRKQIPAALEALRGRSKETEESMKEGGWSEKSPSLTQGKAEVKTGPCPNPNCDQILTYTTLPSFVTCPKCGVLAFFGTPAQMQEIKRQIGLPKEEPKTQETSQETKGDALRETGLPPS